MTNSAIDTTSALRQRDTLKRRYPDALILTLVGDFYEAFRDDADALDLALDVTPREIQVGGETVRVASLPAHDIGRYLHQLVNLHYKVAQVDPVESPAEGAAR